MSSINPDSPGTFLIRRSLGDCIAIKTIRLKAYPTESVNVEIDPVTMVLAALGIPRNPPFGAMCLEGEPSSGLIDGQRNGRNVTAKWFISSVVYAPTTMAFVTELPATRVPVCIFTPPQDSETFSHAFFGTTVATGGE